MFAPILHPQFLTLYGEKVFAVIPNEEFVQLEEWLENAQDLIDLRDAKEECKDEPGIPLENVMKKYNLSPGD